MKILNYLVIIFICINPSVKADSNKTLINELQKGGKLIFIRHAYAPGGGDPDNFDINDCTTQRNLSDSGRVQSRKIGNFFKENKILIGKVYSSEWCRCKETASIAFKKFETKKFSRVLRVTMESFACCMKIMTSVLIELLVLFPLPY